jgi:hypothetical protein
MSRKYCTSISRVLRIGWLTWVEIVACTNASEILKVLISGSGSFRETKVQLMQRLILVELTDNRVHGGKNFWCWYWIVLFDDNREWSQHEWKMFGCYRQKLCRGGSNCQQTLNLKERKIIADCIALLIKYYIKINVSILGN